MASVRERERGGRREETWEWKGCQTTDRYRQTSYPQRSQSPSAPRPRAAPVRPRTPSRSPARYRNVSTENLRRVRGPFAASSPSPRTSDTSGTHLDHADAAPDAPDDVERLGARLDVDAHAEVGPLPVHDAEEADGGRVRVEGDACGVRLARRRVGVRAGRHGGAGSSGGQATRMTWI